MTEIEAYISREIEATESDFKEYFSLRYRGTYYNSMRVKAAKILRKKYTVERVGAILGNDHSNVCYLLNGRNENKEIDELIDKNFNEWIISRLYPKTVPYVTWHKELKENSYEKTYVLLTINDFK